MNEGIKETIKVVKCYLDNKGKYWAIKHLDITEAVKGMLLIHFKLV